MTELTARQRILEARRAESALPPAERFALDEQRRAAAAWSRALDNDLQAVREGYLPQWARDGIAEDVAHAQRCQYLDVPLTADPAEVEARINELFGISGDDPRPDDHADVQEPATDVTDDVDAGALLDLDAADPDVLLDGDDVDLDDGDPDSLFDGDAHELLLDAPGDGEAGAGALASPEPSTTESEADPGEGPTPQEPPDGV